MKSSSVARAASGLLLALVAASAGCSKDESPGRGAGDSGAGNRGGGTSSSGGASTGMGGGVVVSSGGTTIDIGKGSGGSMSSAGNGVQTCAAKSTDAQPAPLDIYILLDISASMLEKTDAGPTKWDAVKNAISAFFQDTSSAGLSVGIQYFPLRKPSVPKACKSDSECGPNGGPCALKWCSKYSTLVKNGIAACSADTDCSNIPTIVDYGTCTGGTCSLDKTKACANDAACKLTMPFSFGTCSAIGYCANAPSIACPTLNTPCGKDAAGVDRGMCTMATSSFCFHGTECTQSAYAKPAVEIQALPAAAPALLASLNAQEPDGDTPTGPALRGAIAHAREWANSHAGHTVVAVLATDGLPTECLPDNVGFTGTTPLDALMKEVTGVAADGLLGAPSISTFVIGVFSGADTQAQANLKSMAEAGGTKQAQIVDTGADVTKQFVAALNTVRSSSLACEFQVPSPGAGATLDYFQVNVAYREGTTVSNLFYVATPERCDPTTGGWYYDDLMGKAPNKIMVCPQTCTQFQNAKGSVEIQLGCATAVK